MPGIARLRQFRHVGNARIHRRRGGRDLHLVALALLIRHALYQSGMARPSGKWRSMYSVGWNHLRRSRTDARKPAGCWFEARKSHSKSDARINGNVLLWNGRHQVLGERPPLLTGDHHIAAREVLVGARDREGLLDGLQRILRAQDLREGVGRAAPMPKGLLDLVEGS